MSALSSHVQKKIDHMCVFQYRFLFGDWPPVPKLKFYSTCGEVLVFESSPLTVVPTDHVAEQRGDVTVTDVR